MRSKIGLTFLLGALVLSPGLALADSHEYEGHSLEQLVVEMAHTPADHAALAAHYRAKAAEARAEASNHEKMAKAYGLQKHGAADPMKQHCTKIAANSRATAAEFDSLAQLHEAESKKAK
jgi:hypothetical protein